MKRKTVQKSKRERFKNRSDIKTTYLNNKPKQQQTDAVAEKSGTLSLLVQKLMTAGLDAAKASELVECFDAERIERQIEALPSRKVKSSRTGFLIRAIELDIPIESSQASVSDATKLAEHFYAELGGNSGEPVGFVSSVDEEAAQSLVTKLPRILSVKPDQVGRELARFVLRRSEKSKFPVRSLPLAIRTYGDEFLTSSQLKAETEELEDLAARKEAHQMQFEPIYRQELRARAAKFESDRGDLWEKCATWFKLRAERRRSMSETFYRRVMQQWESEEGRAEIVLEYLSETQPETVPSFWEWDASTNPTPFSKEGPNL